MVAHVVPAAVRVAAFVSPVAAAVQVALEGVVAPVVVLAAVDPSEDVAVMTGPVVETAAA